MDSKERRAILHALVAASNAFHNALKNRGYDVSYGLDDPHEGHIYKLDENGVARGWPLARITIKWELRKEDYAC